MAGCPQTQTKGRSLKMLIQNCSVLPLGRRGRARGRGTNLGQNMLNYAH